MHFILVLLFAVFCFAESDDDLFSGMSVVPQFQQDAKYQRSTVASEPVELETAVDSTYIVGPGDFFEILSPKGFDVVQVSPEGNISVPSCGMVNVNNLPLNVAKDSVKKMLVTKFDERYVQVQLVRTRKMPVSVLGAVQKPGHVAMAQQTRMNAAITKCGGFMPMADRKNIKLIRKGDTLSVNFIQYENEGVGDANLMLEPGDVVFVPYITAEASITVETPVSNYSLPYVEGRTLGEYLDKITGVVETKAKWVKIKKPDGSVETFEISKCRDFRLEPKTEVELWQRDPYVYVGGAVAVMGKALYSPEFHAIDYIGASGVTIITGSWSRVSRIRDGKSESIDPYHDEILPGDYIEIPRSIYESVKDVTLFLASLLSVVATAIIISTY